MAPEESFSPSPESPVLVIGGAGLDIVGQPRGELQMATSNPAQIRMSFGGVARNVAENLSRLGQPVALITAVGEDEIGDYLVKQAASTGIDVSAVCHTPDYSTGIYLGIVKTSGLLRFALDDIRATAALTPAYLRHHAGLFKDASLVFLDANLPKDTMRTVFSLAEKARLPICADPTSTSLAGRLRPYLPRLQLITPNSSEAAILCDHTFEASQRNEALEAAKCLVGQGVEVALVALAEFGVSYATSVTSGYIQAIRTKIIDPTGAGDALTATVIFALLNDIPLDDAVRLGVTAASLTLGHRGTVVPDLSLEMLYDQLVI
jgi:pseudouridine kinase